MATVITSECINCGACEPECPNTAIYAGGVEWELNGVKHPALAADIFYIVPEKCTECVGFFDREACAVVCPVDCCIPDPQRPEREEVLIARARQLHPDRAFPDQFPSRFRAASASAPSQAAAPAPQAAPPAAPEAPAPAKPAAAEPPATKPVPAKPTAAPAEAAPAPKPQLKPAAPAAKAPAPPKPAAPAAPPKERPAPAVAAKPAEQPTIKPEQGPVPPIETFEIPIDCFRCGQRYTVPFKHFRTGVVHFCPACHGSFVVTRSAHGHVHDAAHRVYAKLCREAEVSGARSPEARQALAECVRGRLEAFTEEIGKSAKQLRPPGAPRKRAGIFG